MAGEVSIDRAETILTPEASAYGISAMVDLGARLLMESWSISESLTAEFRENGLDEHRQRLLEDGWSPVPPSADAIIRNSRHEEASRLATQAIHIGIAMDAVVPLGDDRHYFDEMQLEASASLALQSERLAATN